MRQWRLMLAETEIRFFDDQHEDDESFICFSHPAGCWLSSCGQHWWCCSDDGDRDGTFIAFEVVTIHNISRIYISILLGIDRNISTQQ